MPLSFTLSDLTTPAGLERVLRQIQTSLNTLDQSVKSATASTTSTSTPTKTIPTAGINVVQAGERTVVTNTGVTSITGGSGIGTSASTGDITLTNTGVLSITGTANQIIASAATGAVTLSTPQNIDTAAAVQFGSLNLSTKFIVNSNGLPTKSDNITLAGQGFALIVASGNATGQTGANSSVAAYTTPNASCSFEVGGYIDVTAFTAGTVSLQCDYVDPAGASQTLVIPLVALAGSIGTTVGSATVAHAIVVSVQTSTAATIKLYTTVAGWTGTYSVFCWIKQIA